MHRGVLPPDRGELPWSMSRPSAARNGATMSPRPEVVVDDRPHPVAAEDRLERQQLAVEVEVVVAVVADVARVPGLHRLGEDALLQEVLAADVDDHRHREAPGGGVAERLAPAPAVPGRHRQEVREVLVADEDPLAWAGLGLGDHRRRAARLDRRDEARQVRAGRRVHVRPEAEAGGLERRAVPEEQRLQVGGAGLRQPGVQVELPHRAQAPARAARPAGGMTGRRRRRYMGTPYTGGPLAIRQGRRAQPPAMRRIRRISRAPGPRGSGARARPAPAPRSSGSSSPAAGPGRAAAGRRPRSRAIRGRRSRSSSRSRGRAP